MKTTNSRWILHIGTYPPRECGIATFTKDLVTALNEEFFPEWKSKVLALDAGTTTAYNYPKEVLFHITDSERDDYVYAAQRVNTIDAIEIVSIQHEFGIFGGENGSYILDFLKTVTKPVIITFHTVLPDPSPGIKKIVGLIADHAEIITVITPIAVDILRGTYQIKKPIQVIPHGIPDVPYTKPSKERKLMGLNGKLLLSSFGLINKGKGYEYVIDALPQVVRKHPDVLYMILGETHPVVRKKEGEKYRIFLEKKVKKYHLEKQVKFYNKYLTTREILQFLKATDIYISPSINPDQTSSGTLSYAMGCGCAVISTSFLHARDMVRPDCGRLIAFKDPQSFADTINELLDSREKIEQFGKNSYDFTRPMVWKNVAHLYKRSFENALKIKATVKENPTFIHLKRLTDNFGVIQFACGELPDKSSGYTLDDNARALIAIKMQENQDWETIKKYLNAIMYTQGSDGRMYNYVSSTLRVNTHEWSEDAHCRGIWALGFLYANTNALEEMQTKVGKACKIAIDAARQITSPRAVAFLIMGSYYYNQIQQSQEITELIRQKADHLVSLYHDNIDEEWHWFEPYLTYANARIPEGLLYAYLWTKDEHYLAIAEESLNFLITKTFEENMFVPVGQRGWYHKKGKKAQADQQPIEAAAMIQALMLAYKITQKQEYKKFAQSAFEWFHGRNTLRQQVYNTLVGTCHDGLGEQIVNTNHGAESTIAYILAVSALRI